ncbi:MAG: acyltransferase [Phycisphaerae bacterium]|jgi:peptidoglycan/LPS O-acetylase OafA/YrhL
MSSTTRPVSIAEPLRAPLERAIPPRLAGPRSPGDRLAVLDGWRGISIISVLASHLLPLGPARWDLNRLAGPFGMAIVFTLSGFLITSNLLKTPDVRVFLIRRACRILPLAYLFMLAVLVVQGRDLRHYLAYLTFTVNYHQPDVTIRTMSPLWSLCVEVHFYLFAAMLVAVAGRRGLLILPVLALVVTGLRVAEGATLVIRTHLRVDEILAGASVALLHGWPRGQRVRDGIGRVHPLAWGILLAASCYPHPAVRPLNYVRPYLAGRWWPARSGAAPPDAGCFTGVFSSTSPILPMPSTWSTPWPWRAGSRPIRDWNGISSKGRSAS